jgi:hypothetical protein
MAKRPSMTKSPLALAKQAFTTAQQALPSYSDLRSRHDFTQAQIFAILVLRQFFQTDYRGIISILEDSSDIRNLLGFKKLPHFTTLQKAQHRLLKKTPFKDCLQRFLITPELSA